jgi:ATP-dependent RNA helicase DDX47/RRP3
MSQLTFSDLGIPSSICTSLQRIGWSNPTEIQGKVIPQALQGNVVIGLAETGSGKTGAFSLPILTFLLNNPTRFFAIIVAPTRELAFQINEVFEALGGSIGLLTVCLVGGVSMVDQAIAIARGPHVIISTPGRLIDHLQNTKGFNLKSLKILVLDEADRMLSMDFEREINELLVHLPSERNTYLFSATMTSKVQKLKRASLTNPVEVSVSSQFQIPKVALYQLLFNFPLLIVQLMY